MNNPNLDDLRHSCAHLLAAAIQELYPQSKRTIGPAIENGFYFDFDFSSYAEATADKNGKFIISEKDFAKIEQKMHELVKEWKSFERMEVTKEEAEKEYKDNPYKLELINEFAGKGEKLSIYKSGSYFDLCRGGHIDNPHDTLKHFKLMSIAGAYWRGSEKNKMLTRIYGTIFPTKDELQKYLLMLEEAKKRDHRKLGEELDLFTFSDLVGKGLPLFTPKGTMLRELLNDFSQKIRLRQGFQKVWIPHITKNDLYKVSGHWDKFGDELFLVKSQETTDQMVMKPMNCPHHQQIYASKPRSYKDLPIKYLETTTIYRDEKAGELLGLSRVRSATQDDSHTFCTPEQIRDVYQMLIGVVQEFYDALKMNYRARLSFRDPNHPEKYLGDPKLWDTAQEIILEIAKNNKLDYFIAEGEAAFYGPKIDFMVSDALGREWQLATPQLDFVQPKRFELAYIDEKGEKQTPVMIHFALMGSIERFLSVYIEHTAGAFPLWLSPVQLAILPISDKHLEFAQRIKIELEKNDLRVELNAENKTIGNKIRQSTLQKTPYMIIIGDKEIEKSEIRNQKLETENVYISVRARDGKDLGQVKLYEFINQLKDQIGKYE